MKYIERFHEFERFTDNVERIHVAKVSCQEFIDKFELPYKPVVIEGVQVGFIIVRYTTITFGIVLMFRIHTHTHTGRMESIGEMDHGSTVQKVSQSEIQMWRR